MSDCMLSYKLAATAFSSHQGRSKQSGEYKYVSHEYHTRHNYLTYDGMKALINPIIIMKLLSLGLQFITLTLNRNNNSIYTSCKK
jgi:hypothetical protein